MPSETPIVDSGVAPFHRLHPTSMLFSFGALVRRYLVPAVIFLIFGSGDRFEIYFAVLIVPGLAIAAARYFSLRYQFAPRELVVREGIFSKKERHIPYQRIQNVDTSRSIVHRVLGVADVNIQTASGAKPEATLRVLSLDAIETMRRHIFAKKAEAAPTQTSDPSQYHVPSFAPMTAPPPVAHIVARATPGELVRFGLISNRGMLAVAAVLGILSQFGFWENTERFKQLADSAGGMWDWLSKNVVVLSIVGVIALLVLVRLLSVAWALVALHDFTLSRDGDELRTRFGLLTQRAMTIPRHRIQRIDIESTVLHRLFGRVALRARTAGFSAQGQGAGISRDWLMPVLSRARLREVLAEVQPEAPMEGLEWQRLPSRAVSRMFKKLTVVMLIPVAGGMIWIHWYCVAGIVPLSALAWLVASRHIDNLRYALTDRVLWLRTGWLWRQQRAVRFSKIQAVGIAESPFDRRHAMASLWLDTANAGSDSMRIPYLPVVTAVALQERLAAEAAETEFRW